MDKDVLAYQQFIHSSGATGVPSYMKFLQQPAPEAPKKNSSGIGSIVGGIAGGAVGTVLGPVGTIAGGAGGSALGEAIDQLLSTGKLNAGDIGREGALGLAGGVGGKILGAGAKLGVKALGKGAAKIGENLAVRAVKATPSQLTKFGAKHGEDLTQILKRFGLEGADAEAINSKAIEPLQGAFNAIANNTTVRVSPAVLKAQFDKAVSPLLKSAVSDNKVLGQQIQAEFEGALKSLGKSPTMAQVNALRQEFDQATGQFMNDPVRGGVNRALGTILRTSLQDAADSAKLTGAGGASLKQLGKDLSGLRDLHEIATKQANLGRGSNPLGLIQSMMGAAGGAAGGIPGAAAGLAAGKLVNSPTVVRGASRLASGIGAKTAGEGSALMKALGSIPSGAVGQLGARALAGSGAPQDLSTANMGPDTGMGFGSTDTAPSESTSPFTPEMLQALALNDLQTTGGKNLDKIMTLDKLFGSGAAAKSKPLSAEASKQVANAKSGLNALGDIRTMISKDSSLPIKDLAPGSIGKRLTGAGEYEAARQEIVDVLARLRTGAAISRQEETRFKAMLPQAGDSAATVKAKLDRYQTLFEQILANQQQGSPDLEALTQ